MIAVKQMKIKKFLASNMREGQDMIERELGSEAIILSTRNTKLPNGIPAIEFVAALDGKHTTTKGNVYANNAILNAEVLTNEINKKLIGEIASLKEMLRELDENVKYKYTGTMPDALARVYKILRNSDINENLSLEIIGKIALKGYSNDFSQALNEARNLILKTITFSNPIAKIGTKQIISFIGPTGMGKTLSLIKLAVICKLLHKLRILIVTTDTYKVGGIEQIQTLASIAGINCITTYTSEELKNATNDERYDVIFIDTVGRSPNDSEGLENIKYMLELIDITMNFIVLSANSSESSLLNAVQRYQNLMPDSKEKNAVIVTKCDEALGLGNIVSVLNKANLPLAYFSVGQNIPDDIEPANSERFNDYLFVV